MLVYGDAPRRQTPVAKIAAIRGLLDDARAAPPGILAHGLLVGALVEAGELAQGIADHAFEAAGETDVPCPAAAAAMSVTLALARWVTASWRSEFSADPTPFRRRAAARLRDLVMRGDLPAEVLIRQPEGFAHYALYPEAYGECGADLGAPARVIGIRSIGTTLAAMLAAAFDLSDSHGAVPPATLRPIGHPFDRQVSVEAALAATIDTDGAVAIADEGPGFSGSSFAAVALWLEGRGMPLSRTHLFPSHPGDPGPQAAADTLRVWSTAPRHVRTFDEVVLNALAPAHRLERWVADLVGDPIDPSRPLTDMSGGAWRHGRAERDWPPALAWQEKRKFRLATASGTWLLKFAGLGRAGLEKAAHAGTLSAAGFTPEHLGWRHGFLLERWLEDARPLEVGAVSRAALVDHLGSYLGFRARHLPPVGGRGASVAELFAMARVNIEAGLGASPACALDGWRPRLEALEAIRRPMATDNRLHAWEWLVLDDRLIKTDALDHHCGHDLVGPQDLAWDIAGAAIEFHLDAHETGALAARAARQGGREIHPDLLAFCRIAYAAFQFGYYAMAAKGEPGGAERTRLTGAAQRYRASLDSHLQAL